LKGRYGADGGTAGLGRECERERESERASRGWRKTESGLSQMLGGAGGEAARWSVGSNKSCEADTHPAARTGAPSFFVPALALHLRLSKH
jgi:hypothetical protein